MLRREFMKGALGLAIALNLPVSGNNRTKLIDGELGRVEGMTFISNEVTPGITIKTGPVTASEVLEAQAYMNQVALKLGQKLAEDIERPIIQAMYKKLKHEPGRIS